MRERKKQSRQSTSNIDLDISPRPYSLDEYRKASRGQFLYDEILRRGRPVDA
ncbi:MAG: hypothetical protein AB1700_11530 [Bacillota bacterium]